MKWKRGLLRALLAILIVFDTLLIIQAHRHGWPVILNGQSVGDGGTLISVNRMAFTAVDWLVAALLLGVECFVIYGNLRIGRQVGKPH